MADRQISDKIRIGSFVCTILVIVRHSLNLQAFGFVETQPLLLSFCEEGVSKQTEIAVPFFFIVSGFFFLRYYYTAKDMYFGMIRKKIKTLFLPFIIWNVIGCIPLILTHKFVFEKNYWLYFVQLMHGDWNGVLWYVRDIMTMMMVAPLYTWIFRMNKKWLYLLIFCVLFYFWIPVDCSWISSEGMVFFFIGGVLQKNKKRLCSMKNMPKRILAVLFLIWFVSCFFFPRLWVIHRYNTLLGIVVFWCLLDKISQKYIDRMLKVSVYSFFIYVVHLDIIKLMKVGIAHYFYQDQLVALISFFVLPIATMFICIFIGRTWHRYFPKSFSIVTGGRG